MFISYRVELPYIEELTQIRRQKQRQKNEEREEALNKLYVRNKPPELVIT